MGVRIYAVRCGARAALWHKWRGTRESMRLTKELVALRLVWRRILQRLYELGRRSELFRSDFDVVNAI